jgi:acyl carrier protein
LLIPKVYKRHFSRSILVNGIGPTETGTIRRYFIDGDTPVTGNIVPVGYAAPDNQVLLLDDLGRVPPISELRRTLAKGLPDYMFPSDYVFLDVLPVLPNGKVDRRALPPPSAARRGLDTPFVAPRTSVEETLAGIWSEVVGLDRVGIQDNFFELGGNSLSATQVISRVIERFELKLPIQSLFEVPTVEEMAAVIVRNHVKKRGRRR